MMDLAPAVPLNDGRAFPAIGFGTYPLQGEEAAEAITSAIRIGYRSLDTAFNYDNEGAVGEAVRELIFWGVCDSLGCAITIFDAAVYGNFAEVSDANGYADRYETTHRR
jgi:hypothetical protein